MFAKNYDPDKRRVFTTGGFFGVIVAIIIIAALVAITLLVVLPSTEEAEADIPSIVSIDYPDSAMGINSDLSNVYVTVTYSDGSTKSVALSNMVCEGLDIATAGTQNISLSYGGFEQTIQVNVKDITCKVTYTASVGGRVDGNKNQQVKSGGDAETVVAVPETGYTFSGWEDGYPFAQRKDTGVNENKDHIATFTKTKFRVIFKYYDKTIACDEKVTYGEACTNVPKLTDPKMNVYGYVFKGWSVAEDEYTYVTRDLEIVPEYEKYAVDVDVKVSTDRFGAIMGETTANASGFYAYNQTATISAEPYNARQFIYWKVLSSSGEYITIMPESEIIIPIGDLNEEITFTSTKSGNSQTNYTLSFIPTDKVASISVLAQFAYSASSIEFINYQNAKTGNQEYYVDGLEYGVDIGTYLDTYVNGVDTTVTIGSIDQGSGLFGLIVPESVIGMEFLGWYRATDSTQSLITRYATFIEPTTLIAKWARKTYTINFTYLDDLNDTVTVSSIGVVYQNTIGSGGGVPGIVPQKEHYIFTGWIDSLTGDFIDDTTQLNLQEEYLNSSTFLDEDTLFFVAAWTVVTHELNVSILDGAGTVEISYVVGTETITEEINGTYTMNENRAYTLSFNADVGSELVYVYWQYGDNYVSYGESDIISYSSFYIEIENESVKVDNLIKVAFSPISYTTYITNGDGTYAGYVEYEGEITNEATTSYGFDYGTTLSFSITSYNDSYSISGIYVGGTVNGVALNGAETYIDLSDIADTLSYTLTLPNCTTDITIRIEYSVRECELNINSVDSSEGSITLVSFNSNTGSSASAEMTTDYGSESFFLIESVDGKYISSVRLNGNKYDIYSVSNDNVVFYDWEVNGESLGITLVSVADTYYLSYGTAVVDGTTYMYCETLDGVVKIFEVEDDEYYEVIPVSNAYMANSMFTSLVAYLEETLKVNEKRISDTTIVKDYRVTSVKMLYISTGNKTLGVTFENISYKVSVENSDFGTSTISNTLISSGGSSTITAKPINGYYVYGYTVNGGAIQLAQVATKGATFTKQFTGIVEDKNIEIIYRVIGYNITFDNLTTEYNVSVKEDGVSYLLNSSKTFVEEYASSVSFVITTNGAFSSITVNGVNRVIVPNLQSYKLDINDVTAAYEINIVCTDYVENSKADGTYDINIVNGLGTYGTVIYGATNNTITVAAYPGYDLNNISLIGGARSVSINVIDANTVGIVDNASSLTDSIISKLGANGYLDAIVITIANTEFTGNISVECSTTATPMEYDINLIYGANGVAYSSAQTQAFGEDVTISVTANANYYISSFKVNGIEISFGNNNWTNLEYDSTVGKYTGGDYTFVVSDETNISITFSMFVYTVSLDSASTNGTTIFTDSDGNTNISKISHGSYLTINMTADEGYHIEEIYVNGVALYYEGYANNANNNSTDTYVYSIPITRNITVYVEYAINRYGFTYEIVNDSYNFSGLSGAGSIYCDYALNSEGTGYVGISHGENFYINITPNTGTGYYLYSVTISYQGNLVTRVYTDDSNNDGIYDGIVNQNGGSIWFNRFMYSNNTDAYTGVTSDIELITIRFKRYTYAIDFTQVSAEDSGSIAFMVYNASNATGNVLMYPFDDDAINSGLVATAYYYNPTNNGVYKYSGYSLTLTTISLRFKGGATNTWVWMDDYDNEYTFFFEYGLRFTITSQPATGYARTGFNINGVDRENLVTNNKYTNSIYRELEVEIKYEILTFTISVSEVVYNTSMNKISAAMVKNYANIELYVLDTDPLSATFDTYVLYNSIENVDTDNFVVSLDYGTKYYIVVTPDFANHGIYIYQTTVNQAQLNIPNKDAAYTYGYSNNTGLTLTNNQAVRASFRVRTYGVRATIGYTSPVAGDAATEANITNETLNTFLSSEGNTAYSVYWGTNTTIIATPGEGYYLYGLNITYTTGAPVNLVGLNTYEENITYEDSNHTYTIVYANGVYTIVVKNISSDFVINALFSREQYVAIFALGEGTETGYIDTLTTSLNLYNSIYPSYTYSKASHITGFVVRHYDELTTVLVPTDGYYVADTTIRMDYIVWDEGTNSWLETGDTEIFRLNVYDTNDKSVIFSFRDPSASVADYWITHDVKFTLNIVILSYTVQTEVNRTTANADISETGNNTVVLATIRDRNGELIALSTGTQTAYRYATNGDTKIMYAEHYGSMNYTFTCPSGYVLYSFTANGYTVEELEALGILTKEEEIRTDASGNNVYYYNYTLSVITSLFVGSSTNAWSSKYDFYISIVLRPIVYNISVLINDATYEFNTINQRNGVTDGQMLTVYTQASVTHFGSLVVEPEVYTGYQVNNEYIYFGDSSGYNVGLNAGWTTSLTTRTTYTFSSANMNKSNFLNGTVYVYFVFSASIIKYTQSMYTMVYYNSGDDQNPLVETEYWHITDGTNVGSVNMRVDEEVSQEAYTSNVGYLEGSYEYFSTVKMVIAPNAGFALFGIYELTGGTVQSVRGLNDDVTFVETNAVWTLVQDQINGISLVEENGIYTLTYTVMNTAVGTNKILTNRTFRLDIRERTTVDLYVMNPYKYLSSSDASIYHMEVTAYENGSITENQLLTNNLVVYHYQFTMYVGNYLTFEYTEFYTQPDRLPNTTESYYDIDLATAIDELLEAHGGINPLYTYATFLSDYNALLETHRHNELLISSSGYQIIGGEKFYMYTDVYEYIRGYKETFGAVNTTVGGQILYSGTIIETNDVYYNRYTSATNFVQVSISSNDNYEFYRLYARTVDTAKSYSTGILTYKTGAINEVTLYNLNYDNPESITTFNSQLHGSTDSNGFRLIYYTYDSVNNIYTFTFWTCGTIEFHVEFYRVYELTYGVYYADSIEQNSITALRKDLITSSNVVDNVFGLNYTNNFKTSNEQAYVSYNSMFTLTANPIAGTSSLYQFVGWYVNNNNTFAYLSELYPSDIDYLVLEDFMVSKDTVNLISGGYEVTNIQVYAVFEPIIDIAIINEKHYAYENNFNSYEIGNIFVEYTPYNESVGVTLNSYSSYVNLVTNIQNKTMQTSLADGFTKLEALQNEFTSFNGENDWNMLLSDTYISSYSVSQKEEYNLYLAYLSYQTLLDRIVDGETIAFSWDTSSIDLQMIDLGEDEVFSSWQYFNWHTLTWDNIPYIYEDRSSGVDQSGNYPMSTCYYETYSISLSALYNLDGGLAVIPYAISTNGNNIATTASEARPLLIRADTYKKMTINLSQYYFAYGLEASANAPSPDSDEYVLNNELPMHVTSPQINDTYISTVSDDRSLAEPTYGEFEYGSQINIINNSNNPGAEVVYGDVWYRFLGWFISSNGSLYYIENSEIGDGGGVFTINLSSAINTEITEIKLMALYLPHYKQKIYSYNISGASSTSLDASAEYSVYDAAIIQLFANRSSYNINLMPKTQEQDASNVESYFIDFSTTDEEMALYNDFYADDGSYNNISDFEHNSTYTEYGWEIIYYVAAGLEYDVNVDIDGTLVTEQQARNYLTQYLAANNRSNTTLQNNYIYGATLQNIINGKYGYTSICDTLYQYTLNDEVINDYSSYYNTGNGTYYDATNSRCLDSDGMSARTSIDVGSISMTCTETNEYNFKFVSTPFIVYYNLMYEGGITTMGKLAKVLANDPNVDVFTVWDEDTSYGDWYGVKSDGTLLNYGANGQVVIRPTNISIKDGFTDNFKYVLAGMDDGNGINYKRSANSTSNYKYSVAKEQSYARWYEFNIEDSITSDIDGYDIYESTVGEIYTYGPQFFGQTSYTSSTGVNDNYIGKNVGGHKTSNKYCSDNTGTAKTGYKIYTTLQLRFIEYFWKNNAYSCQGIIDFDNDKEFGRTTFIIQNELQLAKVNSVDLGQSPPQWRGMCICTEYGYSVQSNGFDGILNGNDQLLTCLVDTTASGGSYSGLFGVVTNGVVKNIRMSSVYMSNSANASGSICGYVQGDEAEIYNITISYEKTTKNNTQYTYCINSNASYKKSSFVYILSTQSSAKVGGVVGQCVGAYVHDINVIIPNEYAFEVSGSTSYSGGMIGSIEGSSRVQNMFIYGANNNSYGYLIVGSNKDYSASYAGGLYGQIAGESTVSGSGLGTNSSYEEYAVSAIIGYSGTSSSGGICGIVTGQAKLTYSTIRGAKGNYDFQVYDMTFAYTTVSRGIHILAIPRSESSSGLTNMINGKVGGLVGYVTQNAVVSNELNSSYSEMVGVIKAWGGTVGGAVGLNQGMVTGINTLTGNNSTSQYMILVQIDGASTNSYNIGGIVGANFGIVNDASVTGEATTANLENDAHYQSGNIYVFHRKKNGSGTSYLDDYKTINLPSGAATKMNVIWSCNIALGGIVGYNTGNIYNSFIIKGKLTADIYADAGSTSPASFLSGYYQWGIEAGLICGINQPSAAPEHGFASLLTQLYLAYYNSSTFFLDELKNYVFTTGRIQSCYAINSNISVIGREYTDSTVSAASSQAWDSAKDYYVTPALVSIGGIAGLHLAAQTTYDASYNSTLTPYGINSCKISNNRLNFIFNVGGSNTAAESPDVDVGYVYSVNNLGGQGMIIGKNRFEFSYVQLRKVVEIFLSLSIFAGLTQSSDVQFVSLSYNYASNNSQFFNGTTLSDSSSYWEANGASISEVDGSYIEEAKDQPAFNTSVTTTARQLRFSSTYYSQSYNYDFANAGEYFDYIIDSLTSSTTKGAFYNGKLVKTDPITGLPIFAYLSTSMVQNYAYVLLKDYMSPVDGYAEGYNHEFADGTKAYLYDSTKYTSAVNNYIDSQGSSQFYVRGQ